MLRVLSFGKVIFGGSPASNVLRACSANRRCQLFVMLSFGVTLTIHTLLFSATQPQSPHIHPIHTASFSCPNRPDLLTYSLPHSQYIQPLSRVPSASISPHTSPPNSQYIQPLSRVPTSVDLPTYILPFLFSLPNNAVRGRGVRGVVCYLLAMLSLAGGQRQTRFVRAVPTDVVSYW